MLNLEINNKNRILNPIFLCYYYYGDSMEEFNKKSNQEILNIKRKSIVILILTTMFFVPMILFFSLSSIISLSIFDIKGLFTSILFLIPFSIIYTKCYDVCSAYLLYGRDVVLEDLYKEISKKEGYMFIDEEFVLTESEVLDKLLKVDPDFSKTQFYSYAKSLFVLIQEAWSDNDYHKLRFFEDDKLFNSHKKEIIELIKTNKKDIRDKIYIKGILLKDFRILDNKEKLIVKITVSMRRLFNNEETNSEYSYLMFFSRNKGVKTDPNMKLSTTNCYNCGGVIDVSDDGVCNYCNTSLISGEHEWVLVDLRLIKERI